MLLSNAATKNNTYSERAARLLNMKLVPATVAGKEGTRKLMSLVRSWLDLKLWHMQFNIVSKSILLAAQRDPESYRDLIVRVAGYNAYFTDLTPDLQDEIILLPYHHFGLPQYRYLGKIYNPTELKPPSVARLAELNILAKSCFS